MIVYFIFGGICKRTIRVSIDLEKCVPCVGTYKEGTIDPALWYKVIAIDSILVDCDQKMVWWTCEKYDVDESRCRAEEELDSEKVRAFFEKTEQLFRESVELSPTLTELFETAESIFHQLSPEVFDRDGNMETYKNILKILHVYILPRVKFEQKHQNVIKKVLQSISKEYVNIEMLITMDMQLKKNCEELQAKQRSYLLSEDGVSTILSKPSIDNDVIELLLRHAEKDIRKLEDILSILTDTIAPLRTATDETSVRILADTRAKRDKVSKQKENLILAKEELVNGILQRQATPNRKQKKRNIRGSQSVKLEEISDRFKRYERETTKLESLSSNIKRQINIKIKMSSVREAISLTLKEIETEGYSFGYNRKKGSLEVEADLFDPTKKPDDWKTLMDHVKMLMETNQADFRTKHEVFCTRIKESCKSITDMSKLEFLIANGSLKTDLPPFSNEESHLDHKESMEFSTKWLFGSVSKEDCEAVCKQISEHITNIADEIAIEIRGDNIILESFHTQVYICYEKHVSGELMPVLSKLYEQRFRIQCEKLSNWIKEYSSTELDSINKTMKSLFPDKIDTEIYNRQMLNNAAPETSGRWSKSFDRTWSLGRNRGAFSDQTEKQNLNTQFMSAFEDFFTAIRKENTAVSIFSKLHHLTSAVQSAQKTLSDLRITNGQNGEICADDILDILILLICRLDPQTLHKLYAHVNLILHLSPYFLEGNINEYSLVSLTGAYQHLFERQDMHTTC